MKLSQLPDIYCLGLEALGPCRYDLSNPSLTYFSIGQLATVVAMTVALSQIAKPIVKFRLATRLTPDWAPWVGIFAAVIFVFIAAAVRAFPIRHLPVVGYPIFWEFVGGFVLIVSSVVMIARVSLKTHLSKWNAERYLKDSYLLIARGDADTLREYGEEIENSVRVAVKICSQYHREIRGATEAEPKPIEKICFTLLDLWSDPQLCRVLVTRCPRTAMEVVLSVQEFRLYGGGARALIDEIFNQAFSQPDSILHREGSYSGLGRSKSFMNAAFGDVAFLESMRPLQSWRIHEMEQITSAQTERFGDAIEIALRAGTSEHRVGGFYEALTCALDNVNQIGQQAAWAMARIPNGESANTECSRVLGDCGRIFRSAIEFVGELPANLQPTAEEVEIDPSNYEVIQDRTIHSAIANGAFEYVEVLAMCDAHDISTRHHLMQLWHAIFPHSRSAPNAVLAIRHRFLFELRKKVTENLDPDHWFFPLVARLLVSMWGIPNCDDVLPELGDQYTAEECSLYEYVFSLYRANYVAIYERDKDFARKLLPRQVEYVADPHRLTQRLFRDNATSFRLTSPTTEPTAQ